MTEREQQLCDLLISRSGWLDDYADALRKYDSLSSGERYVMRVLQHGDYDTNPDAQVDSEYAILVWDVLEERGLA